MKRILFFTCLLIFALAIGVNAKSKLSPAIDVIANDFSMVKASVTQNGELIFDVNDFDDAIGANVNSITITSLPDARIGRLMLDNLYVVEKQVLYREDFPLLHFVQTSDQEANAVFKFKPNENNYEIECTLKILQSVNLPPIATNGESVSAWTNSNISCFNVLNGYDPEGDPLRYEMVAYPEKGIVTITNSTEGDYIYTPYEDATGTDVFSYRVRDSFGNYSETCVVKMKISKLKTSLVLNDLNNESCLNAAIVMHENAIMTFTPNPNGGFDFRPNEEITKEEFIALVMKAMGAKDVPTINTTRFADDKDISPEYKGYLESAFSLGIIKGKNESDGVHINPKASVTIAEAAKIINRIIGAKLETVLMVFSDADQIPTEAVDDVTALAGLGILTKTNGKISPNSPLTREQTAKILMSLLEYRGKLNK